MGNEKYKVRELTPVDMRCAIGLCPGIYEVTPLDMRCGIGIGCPGIYEVTPDDLKCIGGLGCLSIFDVNESLYFIIGERHDGKEFGLAEKIGRTEGGILVSKRFFVFIVVLENCLLRIL